MAEEIIAVMGATGAGKSSFIKMVTEDEGVVIGHGLTSETQAIIPYPWYFAGRSIVLVDTPGFDDTYRSDGDILQSLVEWLARTYQNGAKLSGIIYLHRITDVRIQGSAMRNLRVFRELCGPEFFPHVTLCASFWSASPYKQKEQNQRINELTNEGGYWSDMIAAGSTVFSERLTRQAAIQMIFKLLRNGEQIMQIQREVVDEHRPIQESSAVATLMSIQLERRDREHQEKMAELKRHLEDTMRARERTHSENLESMRRAFETRLEETEAMNARFRTEIENLHNPTQHQPFMQQPPVSRTPVATPLQQAPTIPVDPVSIDVQTSVPLAELSEEDLQSLRTRLWLERLAKEIRNRSLTQPVMNQAHFNVSSTQANIVPENTSFSSGRTVVPKPSPPQRPVSNAQFANPSIPATPTQPQALQPLGVLVFSTVFGEIHLAIRTMADPNAKVYNRRNLGVRSLGNASRDRRSISAETTINTEVWTHFADRVASGKYDKVKIYHQFDANAPEDMVLCFLYTFAQAWVAGDRAVSVNVKTWRFELRETIPKVFAVDGEVVKGKDVIELVRKLEPGYSNSIPVSKWEIRKPIPCR